MFGRATIRLGIGPHSSVFISLTTVSMQPLIEEAQVVAFVAAEAGCRYCCYKHY